MNSWIIVGVDKGKDFMSDINEGLSRPRQQIKIFSSKQNALDYYDDMEKLDCNYSLVKVSYDFENRVEQKRG